MDLEKITDKTTQWKFNLDIVMPINGRDIPSFKEWTNWSGWKGYSENHDAVDFACYLNDRGDYVLGLHAETPVRAVADGVVKQVSCGLAGRGVPYACFMNIEHGKDGSGLFSAYHHINPTAKDGQEVKKGDVVGTLYKDEGNEEGKLVHLHFELTNGWNFGGRRQRAVNPEEIYSDIGRAPRANPQGSKNFTIDGLKQQPRIIIADFKNLLVNNS